MSQTRTICVPIPEDRTHIDALRDALCGEGHVVPSDAAIISHALREPSCPSGSEGMLPGLICGTQRSRRPP